MSSDLLTPEQRGALLEQLAQGIPQGLAARALQIDGLTGTKLRACRRRDPEFDAECTVAEEEGRQHYQDRLSTAARLRALDDAQRSDRLLEVELATHVPGYEHLRRDRVKADITVEGAIVLDPAWIESLPKDKLRTLIDVLEYEHEVVDGEVIELPAASANGR